MIWILISLCTGALRQLYYNIIHCKQSYFCVSQGSAATLYSCGG